MTSGEKGRDDTSKIETLGIVVRQIQRLRYLRTPYGSAVVNDESRPEESAVPVNALAVGDFVLVRLRPTPQYLPWAKDNRYTASLFKRIPPPDGVIVRRDSEDIIIECDVQFVEHMQKGRESYDIYRNDFVDAVVDKKGHVVRPEVGTTYRMAVRPQKLRNAGTELCVVQHLNTQPSSWQSDYRAPASAAPNQQRQSYADDVIRQPPSQMRSEVARSRRGVSEYGDVRRAPYLADNVVAPPPASSRSILRPVEEESANPSAAGRQQSSSLASRFGAPPAKGNFERQTAIRKSVSFKDDRGSIPERNVDRPAYEPTLPRRDGYDNAYENARENRRYDENRAYEDRRSPRETSDASTFNSASQPYNYGPPQDYREPSPSQRYNPPGGNYEQPSYARPESITSSERTLVPDVSSAVICDSSDESDDDKKTTVDSSRNPTNENRRPRLQPPLSSDRLLSEEDAKFKALFYRLWTNDAVRQAVTASGGTLLEDVQARIRADE